MEGLTNMMEETVLTKIDQLWQTTDFCKCNQCKIDIAAYALNRLPPRYVHSLAGELIHKFDASTIQMDAEITACVYNAIVRIGEDPNHDYEKVGY
ncbi:MAG: late competence development ComFB family protein [Lachnospiraceae bacterium]